MVCEVSGLAPCRSYVGHVVDVQVLPGRYQQMMAMTQRKGPDTLDKTVTYLAKRDGIDKANLVPLATLLCDLYCELTGSVPSWWLSTI